MIKTRVVIGALAVLIIFIIPLSASAEERLALVIGNAAYASAPLRNPANDAADVAATLRDLGFQVTLLRDASKREMGKAIENFERSSRAPKFFVDGEKVVGFQPGRINELLK